ncbi:MAG TPA: histidine phosphatase family protein [Alphaproteobacteria bacterium]|nr:histidine phosphatase family protein [Alphaproteobacteria bacterium]
MRRLTLMRHAEAAAAASGQQDRDRPLTEAGAADARKIGECLARDRETPDQLLCSDARRARETAEMLLAGCGVSGQPTVLPDLYNADPEGVLLLIGENADDNAEHVLVVGHNPTIGALAYGFAARTVPEGEQNPAVDYAPATATQFAIANREWSEVRPLTVQFNRVLRPADCQ